MTAGGERDRCAPGPTALPLPRFRGHLYHDDAGLVPWELNNWVRETIATEIERSSFVA